jgi:hypothetical protein
MPRMSRRDDYVALMETQLEQWTARLAAMPHQSGTWAEKGRRARALLVELQGTFGFVWELRRDVMEQVWLDLQTMVAS